MSIRKYFPKFRNAFEKKAEAIGASYTTDGDEPEAIFIMNRESDAVDRYSDDSKKVVPGIQWRKDKGVAVGQINKDCDNFEDTSEEWLSKNDITWIVRTLTKIKPHLK